MLKAPISLQAIAVFLLLFINSSAVSSVNLVDVLWAAWSHDSSTIAVTTM